MRTTRRAEESVTVFGERGGKSVWKDFIRRGRCAGVVGDGGGKDAKTSFYALFTYMMSIGPSERRRKGCIPVVDSCTLPRYFEVSGSHSARPSPDCSAPRESL